MSATSLCLCRGWAWIIGSGLLACLGCGREREGRGPPSETCATAASEARDGDREEAKPSDTAALLAQMGIDQQRFDSLSCAHSGQDGRITWLSDDECKEARALLLLINSQPSVDKESTGAAVGYITYSTSRDNDSRYVPRDCLVQLVMPDRPSGTFEIYARADLSQECRLIKRVLLDWKTVERLLRLTSKAIARRDGKEDQRPDPSMPRDGNEERSPSNK